METQTRNATLQDLSVLLKDQHARKIDVVAPARTLKMKSGVLSITGSDAVFDEEGVTLTDGLYRPTSVCDEGIAQKLGIPIGYLRRLREERPDMYDGNVNGLLRGSAVRAIYREQADGTFQPVREQTYVPDERSFLVRCFRGDDGSEGVARAFLSDRYATFDHLDALTACLEGVKAAGVNVDIVGCDLTDRRMMVRLVAPEVQGYAEEMLRGYRNPFTGTGVHGRDDTVVWAGLQISNSETGGGAYQIVPRIEVQICKNGLTITKDAIRAVHLGGQLDAGVIRWSEDTMHKNADLIRAKTADAVSTFLDAGYMKFVINDLQQKAGKPVENVDDVKVIGKRLAFSQEHIDGILGHFVKGGQMTAGGVMQAVTSFAQTVPDADAAYDLEAAALRVLEVA